MLQEGKATIEAQEGKINKSLPVFYNPIMTLNRDIAVALINAINKPLRVADPLAASGIRGVRFLLECPSVYFVAFNDLSPVATEAIKKNCQENAIPFAKYLISTKGANLFFLESRGFDYIDLDPFGSPNSFLDSAIKRISNNGILAVTATDTSALCGAYPKVCQRNYWATPLHTEVMHEVGLRILIRKIQLLGSQYSKALTPIFSHSSHHYMRVYLRSSHSKKKTNELLKMHGMFNGGGPLWLGKLWDKELVQTMNGVSEESTHLLSLIKEESAIDTVGFVNIHELCKREKIKETPKTEIIMTEIKARGFRVAKTHFSDVGIRTTMGYEEVVRMIKIKGTT